MKKELIVELDPKNPISEIYRTLRTNIQFMTTDNNLKTILITSTMPGEGKTWVSSNLAISFAQDGKRVIFIDGDMRKGRTYTLFGVKPRPGLSNYLSGIDGNLDLSNYIQQTEVENLSVIVGGNVPPNPSELINSPKMKIMLDQLKEMFDIVIIDGTPSDLVADAIILSRITDKTIVVSAYGRTKKDLLQKIVKQIESVGGSIAGVIINDIPISKKENKEKYYYGYTRGFKARGNNAVKKESSYVKDKMEQDLSNNRAVVSDSKNKVDELREYSNNMTHSKTDIKIKNISSSKQEEKPAQRLPKPSTNNTKSKRAKNTKNVQNRNKRVNTKQQIKQQVNSKNEQTNEILKQIDTYLKEEKKKLK